MTAKKHANIKTPFFVLPAIIQVGAIPIRVEDRELDGDEMGRFDGSGLIQIDVKEHTSHAQLMVTLLHEVGHAIDFCYGMDRTDAEVDRTAHGYAQAFLYIGEAQEDE